MLIINLPPSTRILAADIWLSNFHSNAMSRDAGLRYRKMILAPGGSQNEMTTLKESWGGCPRLAHIFGISVLVNKSNNFKSKSVKDSHRFYSSLVKVLVR